MTAQFRCSCGKLHEIKELNTWTPQTSARTWRGEDAGSLVQTHPPRPRNESWRRFQQAAAVGLCLSSCVLPVSPVYAASTLLCGTSTTFVLSVFLGKDNIETVFRWLDRDKDGRLGKGDISTVVETVLDRLLEPEDSVIPAPDVETDRVQLGYTLSRHMPDRSIKYAVLLPDHPRYVTKNKLRQVARLHLEVDDVKCNFAKRGCGSPFGDELSGVQSELERLGYIEKRGKAVNAPRVWTLEGERWLEGFL